MGQKVLIFGEDSINKSAFHKNKRPINIDEVDTRRIVLSSKHSCGNKGSFKYFIRYIEMTMFSNTITHKTSSNEWIY